MQKHLYGRWTIRLLLCVVAIAWCVAWEKALRETHSSSSRQWLLAGRAFSGVTEAPVTCVSGSSGLLLSACGGSTQQMALPPCSQAWKSLAAIPTQPHYKRGCSPQPGVFEGNHLLLGVQSLLSITVFHRFHVEGYFCVYMSAPCVWHLKQWHLQKSKRALSCSFFHSCHVMST